MQQNLNLSTSQNQELKQTQSLNVSQLQSLNLLQTTNLELQQKVAEVDFRSVGDEFENGIDLEFFGDFLLELQIGRLEQIEALQLRDV